MVSGRSLLIVGASTRAAAFSAGRAGLYPLCADLFADRDLQTRYLVTRIPGGAYPAGFVDFIGRAPDVPWIYTGGLENHPLLVRRMASIRRLWGNDQPALRAARSPSHISSLLEAANLPHPRIQTSSRDLPKKQSWL